MALAAILIALAFTVYPQISFGQLTVGNNFGVESNKINALQQQSQKTNRETMITADHTDNTGTVKYLNGRDFNQPNVNKTMAFLNGNTISNIKFLRNPAFVAPVPSPALSMVSGNGLATQSSTGNFHSVFLNINPLADHMNTTAQTPIKHSEINPGSLSKSPLYITFGSPPLVSSPTQTSLVTNSQPILSSLHFVPNAAKLQTTAFPAQKSVAHQTFASLQMPPTNAQNQAKLSYVQTPPAALSTQTVTPTPDNTVQTQHSLSSLFLSHLLSRSNVEDPSSQIMNHPNRNSKQSNKKDWLPLLLHLLKERNNNCCECGKYHRHYKCKPENINKRLNENSFGVDSKSNTKDWSVYNVHDWQANEHLQQHTVEEEDYSDNISDYSDEYSYYDDD